MAKILNNVQCLLLGLKDLTWQPHTAQLVSGHDSNFIYMSLNLKICHKEPVHNL